MEHTKWQNDWNEFAQVVGEQLQQGATPEMITSAFGSRVVTWTGVLTEKPRKEIRTVILTVPESQITLRDSANVRIDRIYVTSATDAVSIWRSIPIGDRVSFTATLGSHIFPPVRVEKFRSGRTVVWIELNNGRPLGVE